jgi:predicted transcriptional regulator
MSRESITFSLEQDKRESLDRLATSLSQDRNDVLNAAIDLYLETQDWHLHEIRHSLQEAEAGDFASPEEVSAVFAKLTQGRL